MVLVCGGLLLLFLLQIPLQWSNKKRIMLCISGALVLFILSAMKEISATGDLIAYARRYGTLSLYSYKDLFLLWKNGDMKDPGFYMVGKVFADLGMTPQIWMAFIALIYAVAVAFFMYHHSKQPFLSVLVLVVLFYSFTLSGLRQTMAMALCFVAYHFAVERKLRPYLVWVFIAFWFHSSALVFLPAYWIMNLKLGWKHVAAIGISLVTATLFPGAFRALILKIAWNDSIASYVNYDASLSWAGYIIQFAVLAFCVVFRSGCTLSREERARTIDVFINCMVIGLCLQSFSAVIAESFRMSYYYSMCSIVAIPNVIASQKVTENKGWMYLAVGGCLAAYLFWSGFYNGLTYFWQV